MKIPYRTKTKLIDLANLTSDDICIEDIAYSLAGQNRFNGNTRPVYTVAQHSVLCARQAPKRYELAALLHDAHEYILGDIVRPVAMVIGMHMEFPVCIGTIKDSIDTLISNKFKTDIWSCKVTEIDNRMLATEMVRFFGTNYMPDVQPYEQMMIGQIWSTEVAERVFLDKFNELI